MNAFTVREINTLLLRDTPICATYLLAGTEHYGRIIRARIRANVLEGRLLGSLRWVAISNVQAVK